MRPLRAFPGDTIAVASIVSVREGPHEESGSTHTVTLAARIMLAFYTETDDIALCQRLWYTPLQIVYI